MQLLHGHEDLARETLAKIAAQLAGRDPDTHVRMQLFGEIIFDDVMWRYPDFVQRAEKAYEVLSP